MSTENSFGTRTSLSVGDTTVAFHSLETLERGGFPAVARLPYSLKILLENLLRREDGRSVTADDIPGRTGTYSLVALPESHEVLLALLGANYRMTFTHDPIPPEPPAQTGTASSIQGKWKSSISSIRYSYSIDSPY